MKTEITYYRMDRKKIALFRFLLEAYEGVAVLTTVDNTRGLVRVHVPEGFGSTFKELYKDVEKDFKLTPVEAP